MRLSPLRDFVLTKNENPVDLLRSTTRLFGDAVTTAPLGPLVAGEHELRGVAASGFAVGYFASPMGVRVSTRPSHSYFINFGVVGEISAGHVVLSRSTAGVFNPGDAHELRPAHTGTRFLGLRVDAEFLGRELAALTGRPADRLVRFELPLDLTEPKGRTIGLLVDALIEQFDSGDPLLQRAELQQIQLRGIVTALLLAQPHSHTAALWDAPATPHPRALRAAVAFVEANLSGHLTLGDIAQSAGCSARTISNAFRDKLGTTPMAYVRSLRLERVRDDIASTDDRVGDVAYRWGVTHLGRFSQEYRARFGELPSETAARR
ncbi:AraC family transcriptional regulator [Amycolatopsis sp. NBC_00345]|uniref:helix-turn-helix transcriptional regulator n=1 Tax=Amycolatopsis sp. NBC_00345 TaxID=2975955 RepID=UPI002E269493